MFNCLRTLVFFPSVTFSLLADIEIFPWALLYVLFEGLRLSYFLILILFAFFLSWLVNINISNLDPLQVLRSLLAFLNPLFIFVLLSCQAGEKVIVNFIKLLRYIFWFLMIIGFIQYSGLGVYIDILFNFLVPRASGSVLGGVRGVTLLSSEPSRAGYEFLFICLGYRYFFLKDGKKKFIFDLFVFVFEATIIKSATGTLYTLFYLIIRYYKYVLVYCFSPIQTKIGLKRC